MEGAGARAQRQKAAGAAADLWRSLKDLKVFIQVLIKLEDGGDVAAPIAVVGRRPDSHERVGEHVLVALHHELMRTGDELDGIRRVELLHHITTKEVARTARREAPSINILRQREATSEASG